jgi:hypothetical protein
MKRNIIKWAAISLAAIVLFSCKSLDKMKDEASKIRYNVNPSVLEMHGGKVNATISIDFPAKYFNKNAVLVLTPVLKYEGGELALTPVTLQGEKVQANNQVIKYETGGNITQNISFDYKDEMRLSQLVVRGEVTIKKKVIPFGIDYKIADGIKTTPLLVNVDPKTLMLPDKFVRTVPVSKEADINYVINKYDIRKTELTQQDIVDLQNFINTLINDSTLKLDKVKLSSYASPDGPIDLNDKLSKNRGKSAQDFLSNEFKKNANILNNVLEAITTAEDWDGFKKLMEESSIKDKELILRVLSMYSDPVVREKEIKNISKAYLEIADQVLPKLRRSMIAVNASKSGYTDEQLKTLAVSNPDSLNLEELLYAATLINDPSQKLNIYNAAANKYPQCHRAKNNAGVVDMLLGQTDKALALFNEANALKANLAVIVNNMGAANLALGNFAAAQELLLKATEAGDAPNYNLGIIAIKDGKYDAAVNYLAKSNSFNQALAMLLAGNDNAALKTLDGIENADAKVYYLKAVIGARRNDGNLTYDNLKLAVAKNPSLKAYALKDIEFGKLFEDETFKSIVK